MPMPPAKADWSSKWLTKTKPRRSKNPQLRRLLKRLPPLKHLLLSKLRLLSKHRLLKLRPKQLRLPKLRSKQHLLLLLLLLRPLPLPKRLPRLSAMRAVRVAAVAVVGPAVVVTIAAVAIVDVATISAAAGAVPTTAARN